MAERITDLNVSSHRRLLIRTLVPALRAVFDDTYNRERQLVGLKITESYPLQRVDYPCIVVKYEPTRVSNAGVGHEEWFLDNTNVLRKWHHSRFEGTIDFEVFGLSPLDRDLLADALTEVIRFGRLDTQLLKFFEAIYGAADDPVKLVFQQVTINADEVNFGGNSESIAPWQPEDVMVYETILSVNTMGGYYNVVPTDEWAYVTRARAEGYFSPLAYQEGLVTIGEASPPFSDPATIWTNPFEFEDEGIVTSVARIVDATHAYGSEDYSRAFYGH
jgi:hypothetical protein